MPVGFRAYIDESGDEGFVFDRPEPASSRWFVLSAVVTRAESDLETVKLVDDVRGDLKRPPKSSLHFKRLRHEQRLPLIARIAAARVRISSVLVHKPSILDREKFQSERHLLYRYVARYLLERVSWLCRDTRADTSHTTKVIFSNRSCMSYESLREYMRTLRGRSGDFGVRVDWTTLDPEQIEAHSHDSLMGLQIADAVATSFFYAVERSRHGFTEPRYAEMLRPVVYRSAGTYMGYGLKFWPREAERLPELDQPWLARYGRKKEAGPGPQDPAP